MKKLIVIIGVLVIVFVGLCIYKNTNINNKYITAGEVNKIEKYIKKIYMWKEITLEALPKFDDINEAPEDWIWEVIKRDLEEFELTYEEIQNKTIEVFGTDFKKQFPKEGTEYINYNQEIGKYITTGIGLDALNDSFYIKNIEKIDDKYKVEIAEYLEDYSDGMYQEDTITDYNVYIKNLNEDIIATVKNTDSETKKIEIVKENIEKFSIKIVNLKKDLNGNIFVESVK